MSSPKQEVYKLAFVVKNLQTAVDYWSRVVGAGPFFLTPNYSPPDGAMYRGKRIHYSVSFASGFSGATLILLIQPDDDRPSLFTEFSDRDVGGLHHIEVKTDDFDAVRAKYVEAGFEILFEQEGPEMGRVAYVDGRRQIGTLIELHEFGTALHGVLEAMQAAHQNFDGSRPLRSFIDLGANLANAK